MEASWARLSKLASSGALRPGTSTASAKHGNNRNEHAKPIPPRMLLIKFISCASRHCLQAARTQSSTWVFCLLRLLGLNSCPGRSFTLSATFEKPFLTQPDSSKNRLSDLFIDLQQ